MTAPAALDHKPFRTIISSYDRFGVRFYATVRYTILRQPILDEIEQYLPKTGRILDLGCGFGLFALYFAHREPGRRIVGVELSDKRIACARRSAEKLGIGNVDFQVADVVRWKVDEPFDAIYMFDLVHHLPRAEVPAFFQKIRSLLAPGGRLIVKDVADKPWLKMLWTLVLDRVMVGFEPIHYWPPAELRALLGGLGLEVISHRMIDILPYPHVLYVGRDEDRAAAAVTAPSPDHS